MKSFLNNINVEKIIGETDLDDRKHIKIQFNDKNSNLDAIVAHLNHALSPFHYTKHALMQYIMI